MTVYSLEAKKAMRLIVKSMKDGVVPWDIKLFSDLHDYVDANDYLVEVIDPVHLAFTEEDTEFINSIIIELSLWLGRGGQHEPLPVI